MTRFGTFGEALKRYREARGLSQKQLAKDAGFDHSYISRLELGKRDPSREAVERFAEVLELSVEDRAVLMLTAGFVDDRVLVDRAAVHPLALEVSDVLWSRSLPASYGTAVRAVLRGLIDGAPLAAGGVA